MFRLFECCALSFFERFVLSFSLKIERFVSDSAEIWICGLYVEAEMIKLSRDNFPLKAIKLQNLLEQSILLSQTFFQLHTFQVIELCQQS